MKDSINPFTTVEPILPWVPEDIIFSSILIACVASVSVCFRSKEIQRKGTFGIDRARNETRAKKWKRGEGEGEGFLPFFPTRSPLFYLRHFSHGLDSRSSFFSPKTHRNACYAGYDTDGSRSVCSAVFKCWKFSDLFLTLSCYDPTSCTWASPFGTVVLYGELIPPSVLN